MTEEIKTAEEVIRIGKELQEFGLRLQQIDINSLSDDGPMTDAIMSLRNYFRNQSKTLDKKINKK